MSDNKLPPGYKLHRRAGSHWLASKQESGMQCQLLNKSGDSKYWLSEEKATDYCQKHAAQGLSCREEVK